MSKCVSCQADLPPQTRFCGLCGATQPTGTLASAPENIETILSNPLGENAPANVPPPPPRPQQNAGGQQNRGGEVLPSIHEENKPASNSPMGQPNNPPSGPRPQPNNPPSGPHPHPQTSYGGDQQPSQQLQQPNSSYQPAPLPLYGDYQQVPPSPPPYGNYPYGPQSQPLYGNYQQTPLPPQLYGNYPQPPQFYDNYQQPPPSPGINIGNTLANVSPATTGSTPILPKSQQKPPAWRNWVIIAVVVAVILVGSGTITYLLLPKSPALMPTISVTSQYYDNGTLAGAPDTTLHVTGQQFANNSAITFLLDNTVVRQDMQAVSNASGKFSTDLQVTSAWSVGQHKLTAQDTNKNTPNSGVTVMIVQQGYDKTPGPNDAPTNTKTFKVTTQTHLQSGTTVITVAPELDVTGQTDSQGGSVCSPGDDGSQQKNQSTGPNNTTLYEVSTYTCSGTYKEGHITYNDTLDTDVYTDAGGSCTLTNSQPSYIQMSGDYTTSHQFSGNITLNSISGSEYMCTGDLIFTRSTVGATGTWTGTVK